MSTNINQPDELNEDWWDYLRAARAELEAAGAEFRSGEDITAEIEQLRSDDPPRTSTKTFDQIFASVREDFRKSGMTEAELDELLESEIKIYRDEKRQQKK